MKKLLLIFLLIIIGFVSFSQNDSITSDNRLFIIQPIDSIKYSEALSNDLKRCLRYDFSMGKDVFFKESNYLDSLNPNAFRIQDTLFIKLSDNSFQKLITNYPPNTDIEFTEYYFIDFIEDLGLYVIMGNYYEYEDLILVSNKSGELTHLPLEIAIYPSENLLLAAQCHWYFGKEFVCYEIDKGNLLKQWSIYSENLGFSNPILTKNNEILIKKKETIGYEECFKTTYSKLLIIN